MNEQLLKLIEIAKDEKMYEDVLVYLYNFSKDIKDGVELRLVLSVNSKLPVKVLEKLMKDEKTDVRVNVASHKNATDKMLDSCLKDEDYEVRLAAVRNKNVSEDTLMAFCKDENEEVKTAARQVLKSRL